MLCLPLQSVSTVEVLPVVVLLRFRSGRLFWDVVQKQGMWRYNHSKAANISKQNVQDVQIPVPWGHVAGRNHHHRRLIVCVLSYPFCTQCIPMLSPAVSSILLFPLRHPVAALIFLPQLSIISVLPCVFPFITVFMRQFLHKI